MSFLDPRTSPGSQLRDNLSANLFTTDGIHLTSILNPNSCSKERKFRILYIMGWPAETIEFRIDTTTA